jgi:hypothetical protein
MRDEPASNAPDDRFDWLRTELHRRPPEVSPDLWARIERGRRRDPWRRLAHAAAGLATVVVAVVAGLSLAAPATEPVPVPAATAPPPTTTDPMAAELPHIQLTIRRFLDLWLDLPDGSVPPPPGPSNDWSWLCGDILRGDAARQLGCGTDGFDAGPLFTLAIDEESDVRVVEVAGDRATAIFPYAARKGCDLPASLDHGTPQRMFLRKVDDHWFIERFEFHAGFMGDEYKECVLDDWKR